jgi:hypothetical protein
MNSLLRAVETGTYMSDIEICDMFLNFVLHDEVQDLSGVQLAPNMPNDPTVADLRWGGWNRCAMGLKSAPYQCIQRIIAAKEVVPPKK